MLFCDGASLIGCSSLLPKSRFANLIINDPHPDDYHPVIYDLIKTILPFEHRQFPAISVEEVESRLLSLFPIEENINFLPLQRSLMFFNETNLFPHVFDPIIVEEKHSNETDNHSVDSNIYNKQIYDEKLYNKFKKSLESSPKQ